MLSYYHNEKVCYWCRLATRVLKRAGQEKELLGSIQLSEVSALYKLATPLEGRSNVVVLAVLSRDLMLSADSDTLSSDWLGALERALREKSIQFADGADQVTKMGYLSKQGGSSNKKGWKSRWFVIQNNVLSYYKREKDLIVLGRVLLSECVGLAPVEDDKYHRPNCFELQTLNRVYVISAYTPAEVFAEAGLYCLIS